MITKNQLPEKEFYAVLFSSEKSDNNEGYAEMDELTMKLASEQSGYLGYESLSNGTKTIFISYWKNKQAIEQWSQHAIHLIAKSKADLWYKRYLSQICWVERSHYYEK